MSYKKRVLLVWLTSSVTLPAVALAQLLGDPLVNAQNRNQSPASPQFEDRPIVCFSTAPCPAYDLNCDNVNDGLDVAIMCCETNYGLSVDEASCPQADFDCDGIITGLDVARAVSSACTNAQQPLSDTIPNGVDQRDEPPLPDGSDRLRRDQTLGRLSERDEIPIEDGSDRLRRDEPLDGLSDRDEIPVEDRSDRLDLFCDSQAPCPEADVNCDDVVTEADVLMICSPENYGLPVDQAVCSRADVDCNGIVNGLDVALVMSSACMQPLASYLLLDSDRDEIPIEDGSDRLRHDHPLDRLTDRDEIPIEDWSDRLRRDEPLDGLSDRDEIPAEDWSHRLNRFEVRCDSQALCPEADVNCDDVVNGADVLMVCSPENYGLPVHEAVCSRADVDCNGIVNGLDVALVTSSACMQPLATDLFSDPDFGEADDCVSTAICPEADVNCDDVVDQTDLDLICDPANFGLPAAKALHPQADCDGDGYVTGLDVAMASSSACVLGACNSTASCPNADLDCDNLVTGLDIAMMANSLNFGLPVTEAAWPQSDLDGDGVITQKDIAIASGKCFGW